MALNMLNNKILLFILYLELAFYCIFW